MELHAYAHGWLDAVAPDTITRFTSGTTGTFQQTNTAYLDRLHAITATKDLLIKRGTGSSVTATSGWLWKTSWGPYFFRPKTGAESVGWATLDGSAAASGDPVTVGCVEDNP